MAAWAATAGSAGRLPSGDGQLCKSRKALDALVAAGVFYIASQPGWRTIFAVWPGASERAPETKLATEDWPICTTMAAMGSEADWTELDPDFAAGKKALVAEDWTGAIAALKLAAVRDPYNADIQNYIGYGYRRLRQLGPAMQHYQQALVLNRRHRSPTQAWPPAVIAPRSPCRSATGLPTASGLRQPNIFSAALRAESR